MNIVEHYLQRYSSPQRLVQENPDPRLGFIVVVPACREEKLIQALTSLFHCSPPQSHTAEVLVVMNLPENAPAETIRQHKQWVEETQQWIHQHQRNELVFHIVNAFFPAKYAGVGMARKTGMDEAVRRFYAAGNFNGMIISFDADCTCEHNYFTAIEEACSQSFVAPGYSLWFEHPLEGEEYPPAIYHAILLYELFLRYYVEILRWCRFPFAFHTLGSSFAVSLKAYCMQGGMNKLKAGEDFYFLNKIMMLGSYSEINTTTVYPSPRMSDRVPFGTGAAVSSIVRNNDKSYPVFHPRAFYALKELFDEIEQYYDCPAASINTHIHSYAEPLRTFLHKNKAEDAILSIRENCASPRSFCKRFFQWMNGLQVLHYLNQSHSSFYQKIPVADAVEKFVNEKIEKQNFSSPRQMLEYLRKRQKSSSYLPPW